MIVDTPLRADWKGVDVDVTTIEREVTSLYKQIVRQSSLLSPVRTSILNLVVYASSQQDAYHLASVLERLTGRNPSRVVILIAERTSTRSSIDCDASVLCVRRSESGLPFCWERLLITAHGRAADHLSSVVVPLLMVDIPTYLLWRGQPPLGHRLFHRLLAVADQLVIDSAEFRSPGDGFADLARVYGGKQGVNDFHWERLAPWRQIIIQFFDGPSWVPYAFGFLTTRLEFGCGSDYRSATAGALLLLGWMATQLDWKPETTLNEIAAEDVTLAVLQGERTIPIELRFRNHGEHAAGRLMCFEIVSQAKGKPPARFTVQRSEDLNHLEVTVSVHGEADICRVVPLGNRSDLQLLGDELEIAGHDQLYEAVVDMASRLAGREVWVPS